MAGAHAGRRGGRWRKLHAAVKARRAPCWLCGQAIDYTLVWPDPGSFSVDHRLSRSRRPDAAEDPANLAASHLACNQSRGNGNPKPVAGTTSRHW